MMKNILSEIIKHKKKEIQVFKKNVTLNFKKIKCSCETRNFKSSIKKDSKNIKLIAEVKKSSPSAGVIKKNFDPILIAKAYEKAGASAISILTDRKFFQGDIKYISLVKRNVSVPILRKDFIIDPCQVYESLYYLADAILLIADILSLKELKSLLKLANRLGLECLVESYSKDAIEKSLNAEADILGINNRNLNTFKLDIANTSRLIKYIPNDKIVVSESGINNAKDINYLKNLNIDAVLIGESLIKSKDIVKKIKNLNL